MNKRYRLKKNDDIAYVVKKKKSFYNSCYNVYYLKNDQKPLIAISVSKKYGNAVERNYAKRVIREIVRPLIDNNLKYSIVIVVRREFKNQNFITRQGQLVHIFNKLRKVV